MIGHSQKIQIRIKHSDTSSPLGLTLEMLLWSWNPQLPLLLSLLLAA